MMFFNLLNFFAIFLEFSILGRVVTDRNDNFFFPLSQLVPSVLASKEVIMMFFIFLNFFAIFLEFSIPGRVGTDRNDNFFFPLFLS